MLSSLRLLSKKIQNELLPQSLRPLAHSISTTAPMTNDTAAIASPMETDVDCPKSGDIGCPPPTNVVDVDMTDEQMMYEDPPPSLNRLSILDKDGVPLAPIDIDPWVNEEDSKQGTVEIEAYEKERKVTLPPIPKDRSGEFQFKGIKIILPKRMLRPETYRYRLDAEDANKPDDIRICTFEK